MNVHASTITEQRCARDKPNKKNTKEQKNERQQQQNTNTQEKTEECTSDQTK